MCRSEAVFSWLLVVIVLVTWLLLLKQAIGVR